MNIDLLVNKDGDFGLVSTGRFESKVSGVIFDHDNYLLSLEFAETMESMTLNIPVDPSYVETMAEKQHMHIVGTDTHLIHEAYSVPLYHVNDKSSTPEGDWS